MYGVGSQAIAVLTCTFRPACRLARGIHECNFTGNNATTGHGGAIGLHYTVARVSQASFTHNRCRCRGCVLVCSLLTCWYFLRSAIAGGGGAVYWSPSRTELFRFAAPPQMVNVTPEADPATGAPPCTGAVTREQCDWPGCDSSRVVRVCDAASNCATYGCSVASSVHNLTVKQVAAAPGQPLPQSGDDLKPPIEVELVDYHGARVRSDGRTTTIAAELEDQFIAQSLVGATR